MYLNFEHTPELYNTGNGKATGKLPENVRKKESSCLLITIKQDGENPMIHWMQPFCICLVPEQIQEKIPSVSAMGFLPFDSCSYSLSIKCFGLF